MQTAAVIMKGPGALSVDRAELRTPGDGDLLIDVEWSGISAGTERLFWSGRMPQFPGMGYPLVPGYETVGRVASAPDSAGIAVGARVFVPGARAFTDVRNLFGGSAQRLVVESSRVVQVPEPLAEQSALLALAATAHHAAPLGQPAPELIVGHGALGRLLARLAMLAGGPPPVVWERHAGRREGASGYSVIDPSEDGCRSYNRICDVSGSTGVLDELVGRLAPGGEIVLAGFYEEPLSFAFPPAFMRELRLRVAAQWQAADLAAVAGLVANGRLSLDGIITHVTAARDAATAYRQAFEDPGCLKMVLDWRAFP
ncbi:MAG TPA: chlorophyll synthesis pathway protein BchC [Hyphomicrobiaceae bacterium]|nr:chlorophyll synthesis pathway protein BchC [Hyphomicrobiaceae bacterium]